MGYTRDAVKGVSWLTTLRMATRVLALLKTIVFARILVPAQFGAYSVALLVLGFLEVMTETGINVILIQEKKHDTFINSAWIVSILRGIIIAIVIIVSTPLIVRFFNSPESAVLLYVMSIVPILRGFINPSIVKLQKDLQFHKEFWYRLLIFVIDTSVAITLVYLLHDPIGIIFGLIAGVLCEVILSYIIVAPRPNIQWQAAYISTIIHRGKWVTGGGVFNYLFHNVDKIVVGRLGGTTSLGIYQMAYSLAILPITEIADVFSRVTFPIYTKIADDKERLKKAFLKTTGIIFVLTIPVFIAFFFFPVQIVGLVLGEDWGEVASILPILGIFGVVRTISGSTSALFLAVGKQEYVTVVTFVSMLGIAIPLIPLVTLYGILGAAIAALIGTLVAVPFFLYYTLKVFKAKHETG